MYSLMHMQFSIRHDKETVIASFKRKVFSVYTQGVYDFCKSWKCP